jgi:hypothetical protein
MLCFPNTIVGQMLRNFGVKSLLFARPPFMFITQESSESSTEDDLWDRQARNNLTCKQSRMSMLDIKGKPSLNFLFYLSKTF